MKENYRFVELRDCVDEKVLGVILLHNKHSINELQDAINKAKEKWADEIDKYGDDWSYISQELEDFDYVDVDYVADEYVVY